MIEGPFPPSLNTAKNKAYMQEALATALQEYLGAARISDIHIEHIQRRVVRYTLQISNPKNDQLTEQHIIGKVYDTPEHLNFGYEMMKQLWANGFSQKAEDGIYIPKPLGYVPKACVLLMQEASGGVLRAKLKKKGATENHMRQFARAMVKLHRCPIQTGRTITVEERLSRCDPSPKVLIKSYPELADDVNSIIEMAYKIEKMDQKQAKALIHGDFHPGQVHVDQNTFWVLDIDNLKNADPAFDLAKLFSFLKRTERKKKLTDYIEKLRNVFIEEYFTAMGWETARRIPFYEALICLKRACKCLRVQDDEGWEEKMKRLVRQGAICIQVMTNIPAELNHSKVMEIYHKSPGIV